jgi:hypothetical protein
MIVRISTEGQYRLSSAHLDRLAEIDEAIISAVANEQKDKYQELFDEMMNLVRENGTPLDPEELLESAVVLPPPDTTFEEAKKLFVGEGVVPADL